MCQPSPNCVRVCVCVCVCVCRPFLRMLLRFVYERRDTSAFRRGDGPIGRFPAPTSRQADLHTLGGANVTTVERG